MLALCETAGVTLMTAFPMRFSPPVIAAREALLAGSLGRIYGCNATNQGQLPVAAPWFIDPDLAGGGALMDHVVHVADLLRWFFGSEVRQVYAQANRILYRELQPRVETGGIALLDFADGSFASIDCSWSRPSNYPTWGNVKLEIVGEGGLLSLDAFRQASTVYRRGAPGARAGLLGLGRQPGADRRVCHSPRAGTRAVHQRPRRRAGERHRRSGPYVCAQRRAGASLSWRSRICMDGQPVPK